MAFSLDIAIKQDGICLYQTGECEDCLMGRLLGWNGKTCESYKVATMANMIKSSQELLAVWDRIDGKTQ